MLTQKIWASGIIDNVSKAGIIGGYSDGSFRPNELATRVEAVVMLKRAMDKETKNVTVDDATLINVVKDTEELSLWNFAYNGDYLGLMDITKTRTMGRYQLTGYSMIQMKEDMKKENYNMQIIEKGTPTYQVIKKTKRTAIVYKSNSTMEYTLINLTTNQPVSSTNIGKNPFSESVNEAYYLKKDAHGNWSIYNAEDIQNAP